MFSYRSLKSYSVLIVPLAKNMYDRRVTMVVVRSLIIVSTKLHCFNIVPPAGSYIIIPPGGIIIYELAGGNILRQRNVVDPTNKFA
jgi:hypothetical protein